MHSCQAIHARAIIYLFIYLCIQILTPIQWIGIYVFIYLFMPLPHRWPRDAAQCVHLFIYLSFYSFVCMLMYVTIYLFIYLFHAFIPSKSCTCNPIFIYLCIQILTPIQWMVAHLFIYLYHCRINSIVMPLNIFIYLFIYHSTRLSVC